MADQVTISTFLELKDNLSPKLKTIAEQLDAITGAAAKSSTGVRGLSRAVDAAGRAADHSRASVNGLSGSMTRAGIAARMSSHNINRLRQSTLALRNDLFPVMGLITAVFGYQALKSVVNLGREFENMEYRIAGTVRAFNLAPSFGQAELRAKKVFGILRDMAAKLPGEAEDYAEAFTTALPKLIASGMTDLTKAADFVSKYTAVAISNSVDAAQAGRDLMLMLSGRAGLQVKTFVALSERIGMTAKQFNKLSKEARLERIMGALGPYQDLLERVGEGFEAKLGAAKSAIKEILNLASKPLFVGLKKILEEVEVYLRRNKDTLVESAQVIARDIVDGFNKVKDFLFQFPDKLNQVWELSKDIAAIWVGATLVSGVTNIIRLFKELRTVLLSIKALDILPTGLTGGIPGKLPGGALSKYAFPVGVGTAAVGAGLFSLLYPSEAGGDRELAFEAAQQDRLRAMEELNTKYADVLMLLRGETLVHGFMSRYRPGGAAAGLATPFGKMNAELLDAENQQERFVELYQKLGEGIGPLPGMQYAERRKLQQRLLDYAAELGILVDIPTTPILGLSPEGEGDKPPKEAPKERPQQTFDFRHSRFDIKQEFAEGYDPDRIAVAFANDLGRLGEMKLQGAYGLVGAVR